MDLQQKSAIIPYRIKKTKWQILLVRNISDTKWVIPKGNIPKNLTPEISATKEAFEEAGVIGKTHPLIIGSYKKNGILIPAYLMEVSLTLAKYDEQLYRKREWVNLEQLNKFIEDEDLAHIVKHGIKIISKNNSYFKALINDFVNALGSSVLFSDKKTASYEFPYQGKTYPIEILRNKNMLTFSLNSKVQFENEKIKKKDVLFLISENNKLKPGYWTLKSTEPELKTLWRLFDIDMWLIDYHAFYEISKNLCKEITQIQKIYNPV